MSNSQALTYKASYMKLNQIFSGKSKVDIAIANVIAGQKSKLLLCIICVRIARRQPVLALNLAMTA